MKVIDIYVTSLRKLILAVGLLLVVAIVAPQPLRAQVFGSVERDRARVMLTSVRDEIKKNYYDPSYHGVDLDARFKVAEDKLKQATSMGQVFGIIAQAVLDLDDSHTVFEPPQRAVTVEYGWHMQMVGDKCYVVAIKPGSDAETKLRVGDQVLTVDDHQPTRETVWKMNYLYYRLRPQPGLRVLAKAPGGEPRQVMVTAKVKETKRHLDYQHNLDDYYNDLREAQNESRLFEHRSIALGQNKQLFIWKMPEFDTPELIDDVMGKAKGSAALIIDMRGNGGGAISAMLRLLGYFVTSDTKVGDEKMRKETKPLFAKTRGGDVYKGKLIVLLDSQSASASEIFARMIQLEKRGVVIGDHSAGAVMVAVYHPLQLGADTIVPYGVQITRSDLVMTDGKSLEKIGIAPDELKLPTPEEMASSLDPVLAYAASLAGVQLSPQQAGSFFPVLWKK